MAPSFSGSEKWMGALVPSLVLFLFSLGPGPLAGQEAQRTIGFHIGRVQAKQLWDEPITGQSSNGLSVGVQVDVPTPARLLSVVVGLGYVQRGSGVWDTELDPERERTAAVRSHYLSVPIHGKLGTNVGPMGAYLLAGPTMDLLLDTQCPQDFCALLTDDRPTGLSVSLGGGVSIDVPDRARIDLEVRLTEGLSAAYDSNNDGVRYRSLEFLIRAGIPF